MHIQSRGTDSASMAASFGRPLGASSAPIFSATATGSQPVRRMALRGQRFHIGCWRRPWQVFMQLCVCLALSHISLQPVAGDRDVSGAALHRIRSDAASGSAHARKASTAKRGPEEFEDFDDGFDEPDIGIPSSMESATDGSPGQHQTLPGESQDLAATDAVMSATDMGTPGSMGSATDRDIGGLHDAQDSLHGESFEDERDSPEAGSNVPARDQDVVQPPVLLSHGGNDEVVPSGNPSGALGGIDDVIEPQSQVGSVSSVQDLGTGSVHDPVDQEMDSFEDELPSHQSARPLSHEQVSGSREDTFAGLGFENHVVDDPSRWSDPSGGHGFYSEIKKVAHNIHSAVDKAGHAVGIAGKEASSLVHQSGSYERSLADLSGGLKTFNVYVNNFRENIAARHAQKTQELSEQLQKGLQAGLGTVQ